MLIGTLVGPWGLKGDVKLYPVTQYPERIPSLQTVHLRLPDGAWRTIRIRSARPHGALYLLRLEGIDTVEAAEALRGAEVRIDPEQAMPPPPGQYWVHEIIGLRVVTVAGEELGTIGEVLHTGANDVYVADDLLIPATRDAVLEIDLERGVVVVPSREYLSGEAPLPAKKAEGRDEEQQKPSGARPWFPDCAPSTRNQPQRHVDQDGDEHENDP